MNILILCLAALLGQDLFVVNADLRGVQVPDQTSVLHVAESWFLAAGDPGDLQLETQLLEQGPVQLTDYSIVHLRTPEDTHSASAVGEVLFCRGNTALVKNGDSIGELTAYPGVHLVQPLRVYSGRSTRPFRPGVLSDPFIHDIVEAVDEDSLTATIQTYEDYVTRLCVTDQFHDSCEWTHDKFTSYGIDSQVEEFDFTFYGTPYTSWNVVGEKPGIIEPDVIVIICGHLDSITMSNPFETAPGADDNGSGSAAVVEAARVLSEHDFRYTIRFICFGAEELGLIGSDIYAQEAAANGDSIIAVVNLDMILYAPEGLRQLFIPYNTISEELAMNMEIITATYVPELDLNVQYSPGTTYSDHASFWQQGYPALLGIEQGVDQNPYYHQENDLLANYMEYFPFGTECAKAAIATVAVYADPLGEGVEEGSPSTGLILSAGPIPAASTLSVELGGFSGPLGLNLYDMTGRGVASTTAEEGTTMVSIDVSGLPRGIYALRGTSGSISESSLVVISR